MNRLIILVFTLFAFQLQSFSQEIKRMEPPFWWAGMVNPELQLMAYGDNLAELSVSLEEYSGVRLVSVTRLENPNYLVIDLALTPDVKPGSFTLQFKKGKKIKESFSYELKQRSEGSAMRKGFDPSDVMYLITPDRFANGNPDNDEIAGMREKPNRDNEGWATWRRY